MIIFSLILFSVNLIALIKKSDVIINQIINFTIDIQQWGTYKNNRPRKDIFVKNYSERK